jgi:DNA-binding NtrC family response regulator
MRRVLFVDDDSDVLRGMRRVMRLLREEWEAEFVPDGSEALETLAKTPFDVIVSDMRMPGMDGADLLTEVRNRYPGVARVVLSGNCDQEMARRGQALAHQFLTKPCDVTVLKDALAKACDVANAEKKGDPDRE